MGNFDNTGFNPQIIEGEGSITVRGSNHVIVGDGTTLQAATQADWFIDPVNGDDEADGKLGEPIKTAEEMRRRIGDQIINQVTTVHLLGDFLADNPVRVWFNLGPQGQLRYVGTTTILHGPALVTSSGGGGNSPFIIDDTTIPDWTVAGLMNTNISGPKRLRIVNGSAFIPANSISWSLLDAGAFTTRVTPFVLLGPLTFLPAVVGETFVVESLSSIEDLSVDVRVSSIMNPGVPFVEFESVFLPFSSNIRPSVRSNNTNPEQVIVRFIWSEVGQVQWANYGVNQLTGCKLAGSFTGPEQVTASACAIFAPVTVQGLCTYDLGTVFQGAKLTVRGRALAVLSQAVAGDSCGIMNVADPTGALEILPGAEVNMGNRLYGSENAGIGMTIRSCSQATYNTVANASSLEGSAPGVNDISVGGTLIANGAAPFTEAAELAAIRREL